MQQINSSKSETKSVGIFFYPLGIFKQGKITERNKKTNTWSNDCTPKAVAPLNSLFFTLHCTRTVQLSDFWQRWDRQVVVTDCSRLILQTLCFSVYKQDTLWSRFRAACNTLWSGFVTSVLVAGVTPWINILSQGLCVASKYPGVTSWKSGRL